MLAEQEIEFDSLDLSYESATLQDEPRKKDSDSHQLAPAMFASDATAETEETSTASDSLILDITV